MQGVGRAGEHRDVIFLHILGLRDRLGQFGIHVAGGVSPAERGDLRDGLQSLLAGPHGILVLVDPHGIGVHGAAASASGAPLGILRHGEFVVERQPGAGGEQGRDASQLAAGESFL